MRVFEELSVEPLSEFSLVSLPVMATVTVSVGWASRTTVNVAVEPASVVTRGVLAWAMVMPATSSSVFLMVVEADSVPA